MASRTGANIGGQIRLRDVSVRYGRRLALEAVSGEFAPGSLTAVVGENGAGKSTLLGAIAGTVRLATGAIEIAPSRQLAYLPQLAAIDREFPLTVAELIMLGGWRDYGAFGSPDAATRARAAAAAERVGLGGRLTRRIGQISRGELQRALFARLIVQDAPIVLLDEPFAAIDAQTVTVLLDHVLHWHREGRTVIVVLHDVDLVRAYFPTALLLARRCLAWGATGAVLAPRAA